MREQLCAGALKELSNLSKLQSQQCPGRGVADVHFDGISREHRKGNSGEEWLNVRLLFLSSWWWWWWWWWWHSYIVELLQRRAFDLVLCFGEHQYQRMVLPACTLSNQLKQGMLCLWGASAFGTTQPRSLWVFSNRKA